MSKIDPKVLFRAQKERVPENATKEDMRNLSQRLERRLMEIEKRTPPQQGEKPGLKAVRMIGRGFADIGKSLATPQTNKRPRISQMPGRKADIGISLGMKLDFLKSPELRGTDIRGRNKKSE